MARYRNQRFSDLADFDRWLRERASIRIAAVFPYRNEIDVVYEVEFVDPVVKSLALLTEGVSILRSVLSFLNKTDNRIVGGSFRQIGNPMLPIQPGNSPQFQVTPTWATPPADGVTTKLAQASVTSSDPVNFPVALNGDDPTGLTFTAAIPATAVPTGGNEAITVTWSYENADGTTATVTGTVTEIGIVDDVTGGTFAQTV
jgi:hypothetical protein